MSDENKLMFWGSIWSDIIDYSDNLIDYKGFSVNSKIGAFYGRFWYLVPGNGG